MSDEDDFQEESYLGDADLSCDYCGGSGGDPWNDYILPCPKCDGEGYRWWE